MKHILLAMKATRLYWQMVLNRENIELCSKLQMEISEINQEIFTNH